VRPGTATTRRTRGKGLLSAAEEQALAERIARGDRAAREQLVRANFGLVHSIAQSYRGRGLDDDDLISEGNLGLITAVDRFDPRFNTRFGTYAALWIKQAIRQALANTAAMIRIPAHMVNLLGRWYRAAHVLERSLGRTPRPEEIAEQLNLSTNQLALVQQALSSRVRSGSGLTATESDWSPEQVASPGAMISGAIEAAEDGEDLAHRLGRLDPRERAVITYRFGLAGEEPLTLKEVGQRLGVTGESVRLVEKRAIQRLSWSSAWSSAKRMAVSAHRIYGSGEIGQCEGVLGLRRCEADGISARTRDEDV
jgi:RNA polymerase primary sigma factor